MQPFSFIVDNFLKGKETYAPIRRILGMLLSISAASFLFETFYFRYQWLDITDYKGIVDFFIRGNFVIPLILFLFVHYMIYLAGTILFSLTINKKSTKWISEIVKLKIKKKDLDKLSKGMYKGSGVKLPFKVPQTWFVQIYLHLKNSIHERQWKRAQFMLQKQTQIIERNFQLLFKAIVVLTIYFVTVPHFGLLTFSVSILLLIGGLIFLWHTYLILDVLPVLLQKIDAELQLYLAEEAIAGEEAVS